MLNDPNGFQTMAWGITLTTRPDVEITSINFVSSMAFPSPFLVALTVD